VKEHRRIEEIIPAEIVLVVNDATENIPEHVERFGANTGIAVARALPLTDSDEFALQPKERLSI